MRSDLSVRTQCSQPLWAYFSAIFVVLQILDGVLTGIGVSLYGMDLEANPIAASAFVAWGTWQGAAAIKVLSFAVFFGFLWYCLKGRWTILDVVGLLWNRKPRRDRAYALACFNVVAVVTTIVSLYAGGGWIYLLICLGAQR